MNRMAEPDRSSSYITYIKRILGLLSSPRIIPFISFANNEKACISGLVVEENGISKPVAGQSRWKNIKAMIRRYTGNELENVRVNVSFGEVNKTVKTDKYGIFHAELPLNVTSAGDGIWHNFHVKLLRNGYDALKAEGELMLIDGNPQYGIISDVDDTILVSHATQKLMKLKLMFFNNAHTRMPFEGVSGFYKALQKGTETTYNPIFYVSNSEWNLYDLLHEFIEFHRIPKGPLLLREMAIRVLRPWKLREVNRNHKTEKIQHLLDTYPKMKFILIGDSGQRDPEIYSSITRHNPGRIIAVYIRDAGIEENLPDVKSIAESLLNDTGTEMILVKDSEGAAEHALERGYIKPDQVKIIHDDKLEDIRKKDAPAETML